MNKLDFFTPVSYQDTSKSSSLMEKVDDYFYLGGKKAYVLQGKTKNGQEKVVLSEAQSSLLGKIGKILSYFTLVIPLAMLIAKAGLRSQHNYKVIDPQKKLEKGMQISEKTAAKIRVLVPKIIAAKDDKEIEWLSTGNNLVFKIAGDTKFVFKISRPNHFSNSLKLPRCDSQIAENRFANMIKAKEICLKNDLHLLRIPHAIKLPIFMEGSEYVFIVEEQLNFASEESAQEELYSKHSQELKETARQLANFVANSGFNDVAWRNIPIIAEPPGFKGPREVALIDLEHMQSKNEGFLGSMNGSRGLIACLPGEQIDIAIAEANRQGARIPKDRLAAAKSSRLKEIEEDKRLRAVYEKNGIKTGKEPIKVDLETLDLDLSEEAKIRTPIEYSPGKFKWGDETVTLEKVATEFIAEVNRLIQLRPDDASIKGKRYIALETNTHPFMSYANLGLPTRKVLIDEEDKKQLWLHRIIQALVKKDYLVKLDIANGHAYFIQA